MTSLQRSETVEDRPLAVTTETEETVMIGMMTAVIGEIVIGIEIIGGGTEKTTAAIVGIGIGGTRATVMRNTSVVARLTATEVGTEEEIEMTLAIAAEKILRKTVFASQKSAQYDIRKKRKMRRANGQQNSNLRNVAAVTV